ncbi:MAG TPA: cbb3-type cytochrome c oxidase subunit 3 [Candidatus Eisenbacteria bacterium]|jgi:cbb3-type cytochrome oxidase subunit 3
MRLSDVMSHSGLTIYAEIALILFFLVFIAVVARTFLPSRHDELRRASRLPLDDDATDVPGPGARS